MKVTKLLQRTTSLFLALVMLFSFPVGAYSEGTGSNSDDALEVPEGYVWRALSVELAPFEEDCLEKEEAEAARLAEKAEEAARMMELTLSRDAAVAEEEKDNDSDPVITVRGWMPEYVTARAELVPYAEKDLYAELALMQVELRFYDAEGRLWTPEVPLTVFVDGTAIREARAGKMDPTVYVYEEDFEAEELRKENKRSTEEPERLFSVQAFSAARAEGQEKSYELEEKEVHADVVERALTADDEYPDAVCFETASGSLRFSVTARQQSRNYSAATEDGETEIVVVGALPTGLSAQVAAASVEADTLALPGEVIRGWDLSLTHPEEADYQIDGTVKVALHDAALADEQNENWELQLWQLRENDTPVRVKSAAFRGEDLRFSASELSSYVVVRVAVEKCLTASDGNTYSVRVSYDSFAGIPAGAELEVREILPEDADYAKYLTKGAACAGQKMSELDFARLFDISLRDPETGVEYQPNQNVKVSIELLSEEMNESTEVNVVHFGQETEVMGSVVNGDAIAFETKGFSVYVVMGVTLQKTITAADGNSYEISVSYDKNAGIPTDAELKVRELTGDEYQKYLTKTANYLSLDPEQLVYTRLFDITIEKDGVAYEPNQAVSVSIKLADRPVGELCVVHFGEEGTETMDNTVTEDGTLQFKTGSFSVYAITDKEGNVLDPLAYFEFYYSNGDRIGDDNSGTQIVRNNGMLREVKKDENAGLYFMGWYTVNEDGSWGDAIDFSKPISVKVGEQASVSGNTVTVPKSGDPQNPIYELKVKVKVRYSSNFAWLRLMKPTYPSEAADHSLKIPIPEGQNSMVYTIPDLSDENFRLNSELVDNQYTLYAWSTKSIANYYIENDPRLNGEVCESLTVEKGKDYYLYPILKKGNWVFFNTSPVGAGASSVAPYFVAAGEKLDETKIKSPKWRGRLFKYWTTTPTFEKETGVVYQSIYEDQDNYRPAPEPFDFEHTTISSNLELYAHWDPSASTYTVIVWKQSVKDDRDCPDAGKTYEYDSQYVIDAMTDTMVNLQSSGTDFTALDSNPETSANFAGFEHKKNQNSETGGLVDTVEAKVRDNGSTVLNVYYDRKMVYIKFFDYTGKDLVDFNDPHYTMNPSYAVATGTSGTQYGWVDGNLVALTRKQKSIYTSYRISAGWINYSTSNTAPFYIKDGDRYVKSGYRFDNPPPKTAFNSQTFYYNYYGNYYNIYSYSGNQNIYGWYANGKEYLNVRYYNRLDDSVSFWFYGLYGQPLSKYGYTWPSETVWGFFDDNPGGTGTGYSQEVLPQFILFDDVRDPNEPLAGDPAKAYYEETEIRLFSNGKTGGKIFYHLQQPDGTYLKDTEIVGSLSSASSTVKFDEIFGGYQCYGYQLIGNGQTFNPALSNWRTDFKDANGEYQWISLNGKELHVAYALRSYSISYYDSLDGQLIETLLQDGTGTRVKSKQVLYGADISKFYPDPEFKPDSQIDGWHFNGRWYSDKGCKCQAFFGEKDEAKLWYYHDEAGEKIYTDSIVTPEDRAQHPDREYFMEDYEVLPSDMPNRNLALYAGFSRSWYWVKIDPNGGALNKNDPSNISSRTFEKVEFESVLLEELYSTIERNYIACKDSDSRGTFYYHYDEFNMNDPTGDQPATRKAYYTEDPTVDNDGKKYRPVENDEEGYEFAGWYKVEEEQGAAGQKASRYNFGEKITENTTLRAMWKTKGNFLVYYDVSYAVDESGEEVEGLTITGEAPVDEFKYGADSTIPVLPCPDNAKLSATKDGKQYDLVGWFFVEDVVAPGGVHTANRLYAERHPVIDSGNPRRPYNTFIFRPVFKVATPPDNSASYTSLILDANGGEQNTEYTLLPEDAEYREGGKQVWFTQKLLNMAVKLPVKLPDSEGSKNVFVKEKAEFLGWAFNSRAVEPTFYPNQIIGVDNQTGSGFDSQGINKLYAVWRMSEINVKIRLRDLVSNEPIPGAQFTLTGVDGVLVSKAKEDESDLGGFLAKDDTIVFTLKTPNMVNDEYGETVYAIYTLDEIQAASGYIPLPAPVTIKVDYYGRVDVQFNPDEVTEQDQESLNLQRLGNGEFQINLSERPAICKVANGSNEKLFGNLNDALDYIVAKMPNKTGTIQMIRHYEVPDEDVVTVEQDVNVTLTTATEGFIEEDTETAKITRKDSGNSLFTVKGGSFALNNVVLDGAGAKWTGLTDGGLVCVTDGGKLSVGEGATLQNSTVKEYGGAIYLGSKAEATVTGGTITGNKAANGAGIYVSADAKLKISGNINFGGSGVVGESLSTTSGNFSTTPISGTNPTNATMSYAYGRQDIYLAETEDDDPKMLFVTGELTGGDGTIWLWAESENHYGKNRDFAEVTSPALLTETTMHAFRNAREDSVTACGTKYLTGQVGTKQNWIAWTGGINVNFRKVDGFGKELAGAKFQLFTNLECNESVMNKEGQPVTAISDEKGVVTFETVSSGIYYVQEVAVPKDENGNDLYVRNTNTYILLVGKEYVKVPEASDKITGAWANVLLGIKQEEIDDQRNAYTEIFNDTAVYGEENPYKREVTDYAMFRLETKNNVTRYTTLPDIARIGIVNYSTTKRPVILSKINTVLMPLSGGKFTLRGLDGVEIENDNLKDSDESGVFFVGLLSVGTYLLEETQAPINPKNADEHYSVPKHYFVFQVTDQGVMALKKGQDDEQSFALTNTVTEASGEKYEIKNQNS